MHSKDRMATYGCSDLASRDRADLCEAVLEEIQVPFVTLWALIDNLRDQVSLWPTMGHVSG